MVNKNKTKMIKNIITILVITLTYFLIRIYITFNNITIGKNTLEDYQSDYCEKILYENMSKTKDITIPNVSLNDIKTKYEEFYKKAIEESDPTELGVLEKEFMKMLDIYSCFNKEVKKDKFILLYIDGYSIDQFDVILNTRFEDSLILKERMIDFKQSGSLAETLMSGKNSQNYPATATKTDNIMFQLTMLKKFIKKLGEEDHKNDSRYNKCTDSSNKFRCFMSNTDEDNVINGEKINLRIKDSEIKINNLREEDINNSNRDSIVKYRKTSENSDNNDINDSKESINIKNKELFFVGTDFPINSLMGKKSKEFNVLDIHQKKETFLFEYICNYIDENKDHITYDDLKKEHKKNMYNNRYQIINEVYNSFTENPYSQEFFNTKCFDKFKKYDNVLFYTTVLDSLNHAFSKFYAETVYYTTASQIFLGDVMNWIDNNPEYALYLISDHGGQSFLTEDNFSNHGCSKNNEGFLFTYFGSNGKDGNKKINEIFNLTNQSTESNNSNERNDELNITEKETISRINQLKTVENNDMSSVISYFTNGINAPIESSGIFPIDLIKDEYLKISVLRHKELQIKDFSEKLVSLFKSKSKSVSSIKKYIEFDFKGKKITNELALEYKTHIMSQQDYYFNEAVFDKSILVTIIIIIIILGLSYFLYLPIYYIILQINQHCVIEIQGNLDESYTNTKFNNKYDNDNFVIRYFKSIVVFKVLLFVFLTEFVVEFAYYLILKNRNFNSLFFNANYAKLGLELYVIVHLYLFIYYNNKDSNVIPNININSISDSGLKTNLNNNYNYTTTSSKTQYNDINRSWLTTIKYMIILLIIKSTVSFFFIYFKLLAKMKIHFIDLNIEQYLDILNYLLYILISYVFILKNKNSNFYLFNFNNKNYIKLNLLFTGIQFISLCLMIKYDYFSNVHNDDASAENPTKAFYARVYYSLLLFLIILFIYNKKLYTESLDSKTISNFDNIKFPIFNFFFFINDCSERMVLLLFTIPCMLIINYYIRLCLNHNNKENTTFVYDDNKSNASSQIDNNENNDEIRMKSITNSNRNSFNNTNDIDSVLSSNIEERLNTVKSNSNDNEENINSNKNYYIYLIFCIIAINFIDNMTCVLMKQFSFDISLRAGYHTIGAKLEDFPIFTGIIFVFHKVQNYIFISIMLLDNIRISKTEENGISFFSITIFMLLQIKLIGSVILNVIILWLGIDLSTTFVIYSGNYIMLIIFSYTPVFFYLAKNKWCKN